MSTTFPALSEKKILFATIAGDGHVNPLTGLAVHLKQAGADVRWYCSNAYEAKIGKLGIPFYAYRKALNVTGETAEEMFPERQKIRNAIRKLNFDLSNVFILRAPEHLEDIEAIHKEFPFDMIIADCMFMAAPLVKAKLKVPFLSIGVIPNPENSRDLPPAGLGMEPSYTWAGRIKQGLLRFAASNILFRPADQLLKKVYREHGVESGDHFLFSRTMQQADLHLQIGAPGFDYYRSDLSSNIRYVGAMLPHQRNEKRTPWFDARLNQFDKMVIVTQGTVERDTEKIIVPTLEALKDTDTLVISTTGGSNTAELKKRFPQHNLIIEDFIPFTDIMPYADVYITNGGYGGVLLSVAHELPMVVAGIHEGKSEINARIGYFKLGVNLKTETPQSAQIKKAVEDVLLDKTYKANVIKLQEELNRYNAYDLSAGYVLELLRGYNLLHREIAEKASA